MVIFVAAMYFLTIERPSFLPDESLQTINQVLDEKIESFPGDSNMLTNPEELIIEARPQPIQAPQKKLTEDEILEIFMNSKLEAANPTEIEEVEPDSQVDPLPPAMEQTELEEVEIDSPSSI